MRSDASRMRTSCPASISAFAQVSPASPEPTTRIIVPPPQLHSKSNRFRYGLLPLRPGSDGQRASAGSSTSDAPQSVHRSASGAFTAPHDRQRALVSMVRPDRPGAVGATDDENEDGPSGVVGAS